MLRRVVVAGDGQVGALTALALRKALPATEIFVLGTPPNPAAFADRAATALPFSNRLHDKFGISEEDLVRRTGASHRLVTRYAGWGGTEHQGFASYGEAHNRPNTARFASDWGGGARDTGGEAPAGSLAEVLAKSGKFAPPSGEPGNPLAEIDYALRWNMPAYREVLVGMAQQAGIQYARGQITDVQPDGAGGVSALFIDGANALPADLFIDCTGPQASILSRLAGAMRDDWSAMLPVRAVLFGKPGDPVVSLEDRVTLTAAGWRADVAGRDGKTSLLAMPEGVEEQAMLTALDVEPEGIVALQPGCAGNAWLGNVIALGDAVAHFEPLGWLNLDLAHRHLALLLEMLPGLTIDPRERDEFNRRTRLMVERSRDVVASHYSAPSAASVFGELQQSDELSAALDQYQRRGRIPFYEEMPLMAAEWSSLLSAIGHPPGKGLLAHTTDESAEAATAAAFEAKSDAALRAAPPYPAWLEHVLKA